MRLVGLPIPKNNFSWLDIGSGPGTALWGLAWWCKRYGISFDYLGLEQSKAFIQIGEEMSQSLRKLNLNYKSKFELFQQSEKKSTQLKEKISAYSPDLLCFMNSIGEIKENSVERSTWIIELLHSLAISAKKENKTKWFLLIEPGSKTASRELLQLREDICKKDFVKLWLPCMDHRTCGALALDKDWCHEETECIFPPWMEKIGETAKLKKEALVFSYILCSIGIHPETPSQWPTAGLRMVSQRLIQKGQTECYLCTNQGKQRVRVQHSKKNVKNEKFFDNMRGTIFTSADWENKGDISSFQVANFNKKMDEILFPNS